MMELNYFKDRLFDLLNDNDELNIYDIDTDERRNIFTISTNDGNVFQLEFRQILARYL